MAEKILTIPVIRQEKSNWCYAAVTQMIIKYYNPGIEIPQCDIVSDISGNPSNNDKQDPYEYLLANKYIKECIPKPNIARKIIKEQIDGDNPILVLIGGHYTLLIGYSDKQFRGDDDKTFFLDPLKDIHTIVSGAVKHVSVNYESKPLDELEPIRGYCILQNPLGKGKSKKGIKKRSRRKKDKKKYKKTIRRSLKRD
jgi:hypothetical protein